MLKCHCFNLALQPNLHPHPISSLPAPQGSSWQEVPDTAAAILPGLIHVECIPEGLNPAPDMHDPAISHTETVG